MIRSSFFLILVAFGLVLGYLCRNLGTNGELVVWVFVAVSFLSLISYGADMATGEPTEAGFHSVILGLPFAISAGIVAYSNSRAPEDFFSWAAGVLLIIHGAILIRSLIERPEIEAAWRKRLHPAR